MSEAKFKVGDKVRCVNIFPPLVLGLEYTVETATGAGGEEGYIQVAETPGSWYPWRFELVLPFKAGDRVTPGSETDGYFTRGNVYVVTGCNIGPGGNVRVLLNDDEGDERMRQARDWGLAPDALHEVATPVGKVRMLERGKLLDTEFDSPVAAGDWLRDNGITGEFELIRVESLGKIKASVTVEAA
jgi:hypothetical protein